ncbi:hypothetical protein CHARACLAT_011712 [Characodon lateralis]|uniref:Sushi domain-containing protein n=1 Tax=Characodon lateralis TaxID=208331 RepID=A0ABU7DFR4_9TELE|nr:hypothetical protein [Characodon lateralis]
MATFGCDEGFVWRRGDNSSECRVDGSWSGPSLVCEEISCTEPPFIEHAKMQWDDTPRIGNVVYYQCEKGYYARGLRNYSSCGENGLWEDVDLSCEEISCMQPPSIKHTKMQWEGTPRIGNVVYYQCEEGYYARGLRSYSVCGENGLWEDVDLSCEEVNCGHPKCHPNTKLLWDGNSTQGSVAQCECVDGFYQESGNNLSTCSESGVWEEVSVKCKAECGPVPFLANSDVVWHNRSAVIHQCAAGYHSWRGTNMSVCGSSGLWLRATLTCIEIKPPINKLLLHNGNCLKWKAEKYKEDTELYKVIYFGFRDYQRSILDKGQHYLRSKDDWLRICLNLLPLTNYSIYITAVTARFTVTITANTSLTVPPAPVVYYTEEETPVPTLRLQRSPNTLDPIREAGAYLQQSMGKRQGTPWTGHQSIAGQHTNNHAHTLKGNLELPISLTGMSLDCGRKQEYLVRTHTCTGRTCKLHAERPQAGNRTQDLLAARQQCYQLCHRAALFKVVM